MPGCGFLRGSAAFLTRAWLPEYQHFTTVFFFVVLFLDVPWASGEPRALHQPELRACNNTSSSALRHFTESNNCFPLEIIVAFPRDILRLYVPTCRTVPRSQLLRQIAQTASYVNHGIHTIQVQPSALEHQWPSQLRINRNICSKQSLLQQGFRAFRGRKARLRPLWPTTPKHPDARVTGPARLSPVLQQTRQPCQEHLSHIPQGPK